MYEYNLSKGEGWELFDKDIRRECAKRKIDSETVETILQGAWEAATEVTDVSYYVDWALEQIEDTKQRHLSQE